MVQAPIEVPEADAQGKIKSTYDDIKVTLRVPSVPPVFRALATCPDYLLTGWGALKPNAQIAFFEQQADALRRTAVEGAARFGEAPPPDREAQPVLRTLHYAVPKVFLATAALHSATNGEQPRMQRLPPEARRQVVPGIPESAAEIPPVGDTEPARDVLERIAAASAPRPTPEAYRALGSASPSYLGSAWSTLEPVIRRSDKGLLERTLRRAAQHAVTSLPFRMNISPHVLRNCGLSEADIDAVRATLVRYYEQGPQLVVSIAFLATALDGSESALRSPFPAAVL